MPYRRKHPTACFCRYFTLRLIFVDPEPFEAIMADVKKHIVPGLTHWQSPNFFAFFPANSSPPALLGDMLSSGFGVQGMMWACLLCSFLVLRLVELVHCPQFSLRKRIVFVLPLLSLSAISFTHLFIFFRDAGDKPRLHRA